MRPLRTVLAEGASELRDAAMAVVQAGGLELVGEAVEWDRVAEVVTSRAADLVVVAGDADYAAGLRVLPVPIASLVIAPDAAAAKEYAAAGAFTIVTVETAPEVVSALAHLAVARAQDLLAAKREAEQLREQLDSRKVVERAKGVLMRRLGISEDAAYRRMQKASQDENKKLRQIAESILSAEKLLDSAAEGEQA